mmetsp:Transcript_4203/g.12815  ORF Transcript_4203/g.12815 Transcript_4203/m.12815 type:complete len:238 (-) Transcript_4203:971-1684(-)
MRSTAVYVDRREGMDGLLPAEGLRRLRGAVHFDDRHRFRVRFGMETLRDGLPCREKLVGPEAPWRIKVNHYCCLFLDERVEGLLVARKWDVLERLVRDITSHATTNNTVLGSEGAAPPLLHLLCGFAASCLFAREVGELIDRGRLGFCALGCIIGSLCDCAGLGRGGLPAGCSHLGWLLLRFRLVGYSLRLATGCICAARRLGRDSYCRRGRRPGCWRRFRARALTRASVRHECCRP